LRQRLLGPAHSETLEAVCRLALARFATGQRSAAVKLLEDAMGLVRSSTNGMSLGAAYVISEYGSWLRWEGRPAEALPYLNEALDYAIALGTNKNAIAGSMLRIAQTTEDLGRYQEAETLWREVVQFAEREIGPERRFTSHRQFDLARFLVRRQKRWQEALPILERVVSLRLARRGPDFIHTLDSQFWLGQAYELKGDMERAAQLYVEIYPRFAKNLPNEDAVFCLHEIVKFFVRHRQHEHAKAAYGRLRERFEAHPAGDGSDFERFITVTAAVEGWPGAAELGRKHLDTLPDSLWLWLNKAWIFRYTGDEENYRRVVAKVLALPANLISTNDQHVSIEIAALGVFPFSPEQVKQLDAMVDALERALPGRPANLKAWGYRAIGQMQLRLGRWDKCLDALEKAAPHQASPDPYALFIKALCLHQLGRPDEARASFHQAETIIKPLLQSAAHEEGDRFLAPAEIYQKLLMHREARALFFQK
jgi:tetratricopeptide (TPR) repeat protein